MKTKWPAFGFGCLLLVGAALAALPASAQGARASGREHSGASRRRSRTLRWPTRDSRRLCASAEPATSVTRPRAWTLRLGWSWIFRTRNWLPGSRRSPSEYAPVVGVRMGQPESRAIARRD